MLRDTLFDVGRIDAHFWTETTYAHNEEERNIQSYIISAQRALNTHHRIEPEWGGDDVPFLSCLMPHASSAHGGPGSSCTHCVNKSCNGYRDVYVLPKKLRFAHFQCGPIYSWWHVSSLLSAGHDPLITWTTYFFRSTSSNVYIFKAFSN